MKVKFIEPDAQLGVSHTAITATRYYDAATAASHANLAFAAICQPGAITECQACRFSTSCIVTDLRDHQVRLQELSSLGHPLDEVTTKGGNPTNLKSTTRPVAVSIAYLEQNSIQPKPDADARFGWTACIAKNEVISDHGAIDIERVRCR